MGQNNNNDYYNKPKFNSPYTSIPSLKEDVRVLSEFYVSLPEGFTDIAFLQDMRRLLAYMLVYLADNHSKDLNLTKVYYDKKEKSARAESYEVTMDLKYLGDGKYVKREEGDKMMTQKDREILMHRGTAIDTWTSANAKAYGEWKEYLDLQDAIKSVRDCISADVRILTSVNHHS
jgi:hypothetical protein